MNRLVEIVYLWFPLADEVLQVECVTVKYNSTLTKTSMTNTNVIRVVEVASSS